MRLYRLTHRDLDPLMDRVSDVLALTPDERAQFVASRDRRTEAAAARSNRLLDYDRANVQALEMRARQTGRAAAGHQNSRRIDVEPRRRRP